jgi:dienelactone hydrolase
MQYRRTPALVATLALSLTAAQAQRIQIEPSTLLAGKPLSIELADLTPGQTVVLTSERTVREFTGQTRRFRAQSRFVADANGRVNLATQAPAANASYSGADVRGPLWSMQGTGEPHADLPTGKVLFKLQAEGAAADAKPLAEAALEIRNALPDVTTRKPEAFEGALFASLPASLPGAQKRPALIVLGGSEGGSMITRDAPHFASHGYAVLALPYYSPPQWGAAGQTPAELPGLPATFTNIPVERLQAARDWLAQQPEVDASRIGLIGTSKGAEFALLAATKMNWMRAIVAYVPTDVVWEGWGQGVAEGSASSFSWKGEPWPFVPYKDFGAEFGGFATGQDVKIRRPHDKGRAATAPERIAAARIPAERIDAPLMVVGGGDDQVWASGEMAQALVNARKQQTKHETVAVVDPDAGHFLTGTGTGPTTHYNLGTLKNGGTPAANARTQAQAHATLLAFLQRHLGGTPP